MTETPSTYFAELNSTGPKFVIFVDDDDIITAINLDEVFQVVSGPDGPARPGASFMVKEGGNLIQLPTKHSFDELMTWING